MTTEDIKKYVDLTNEFQETCANVCKHLANIDSEFKRRFEFEIQEELNQVACQGYYTVMCETQDVYKTFPIELLTYTNEQLDAYVYKKLEENADLKTLETLANKYGYKIIKL